LEPFWQAAEDLQAAVFVHPWDMDKSPRMEKYWFPWLIGCGITVSATYLHIA
jgi:aminocarboxymuconate-semialdehyde decarboxylase